MSLGGKHLGVESPNAASKTTAVVAGTIAGADSINDMDVLRHGAMPRLFSRIVDALDVRDLSTGVYGHAEQGAAYGYSKIKGLNAHPRLHRHRHPRGSVVLSHPSG